MNSAEDFVRISDPDAFMDGVEKYMTGHPLLNHDFFRQNAKYLHNPATVAVFAHQLKYYAFAFALIFAEAIRHIKDEGLRVVLIKNLYEEHGSGDVTKTHPTLYRKFLQVLASPESDEPMSEMRQLVDSHTEIARSGDQYGIAGFLLANEYIAPPLLTPIHATLVGLGFPEASLEYFALHADLDIYHHQRIADETRKHVDDPEKRRSVVDGAIKTLDTHLAFWDALARQLQ